MTWLLSSLFAEVFLDHGFPDTHPFSLSVGAYLLNTGVLQIPFSPLLFFTHALHKLLESTPLTKAEVLELSLLTAPVHSALIARRNAC